MNEIILDFADIKTLWELHEYFQEVFHLPEYYGRNMDALWDCLHCSFELPTIITLKNISEIPQEMQPEIPIMLELFRDLESEDEEVSVKIENGKYGSDILDFLI